MQQNTMMNFFKQELKTVNQHEPLTDFVNDPEFSDSPSTSRKDQHPKSTLRTDNKHSKYKFSSFKSPYVLPVIPSKYSNEEAKKSKYQISSLQASQVISPKVFERNERQTRNNLQRNSKAIVKSFLRTKQNDSVVPNDILPVISPSGGRVSNFELADLLKSKTKLPSEKNHELHKTSSVISFKTMRANPHVSVTPANQSHHETPKQVTLNNFELPQII